MSCIGVIYIYIVDHTCDLIYMQVAYVYLFDPV